MLEPITRTIQGITLADAAAIASEKTGKEIAGSDLLFSAFDRVDGDPLTLYAVSHEFVMTQAFDHSKLFSGAKATVKPPRDAEVKASNQSFAKGELFQLHPKFIERLAMVGSMNVSDCPIHSVTHIRSDKAIRSWTPAINNHVEKQYWTKIFDSRIVNTDDFCITLNDIRVDKNELVSFFGLKIALPELKHDVEDATEVADNGPMTHWMMRVQAEANARWIRLRKSGASPTKHNLRDDLAKWCRENDIRTKQGAFPTGAYIARHVLKKWVPPVD
ncbi:hypothetical protein SAMN04515618_104170 [Collimonas sp. OK307]|uniref:hypothetical protein n=1 Tax=Collimonas sp. OK307 TaxID=1801620 RepID=UPI0008E4BC55|nr:hypothetical protein [Collimonas sp. OK307]SFH85513.1 hypothetical protein SAMN04515618_104170 [Collimonas sp. OK307]